MGFLDPLTAIIVSFCFLGIMVYKRVNLGITLNAAALLLAVLVLDLSQICKTLIETALDWETISLVAASFAIMLLSMLYKETKVIETLSESLSKIVNNSKLIVSLLPAVMGLLPVGGGALMSAPLVESEAEKLGLKEDKKTYANLWFRHTIFPIYPVSTVLLLAASLTGIALTSIILRQIPIVISMIAIGYLIGLRKTRKTPESTKTIRRSEMKRLLITFSPILATIIAVIVLSMEVSIAAFLGVAVLLMIAKPKLQTITKPFKNWAIWGITLAAFGAFLLRNVTEATGISQIFGSYLANGNIDILLVLTIMPAFLGAITGSPSGGIAITVSILTGIVTFTPRNASLLYISSYLGYVVAPTHLCLIFTAEYFKCPLGKLYKYLIPSVIVSIATGILVYLLF